MGLPIAIPDAGSSPGECGAYVLANIKMRQASVPSAVRTA
jgi:hypothetical protein